MGETSAWQVETLHVIRPLSKQPNYWQVYNPDKCYYLYKTVDHRHSNTATCKTIVSVLSMKRIISADLWHLNSELLHCHIQTVPHTLDARQSLTNYEKTWNQHLIIGALVCWICTMLYFLFMYIYDLRQVLQLIVKDDLIPKMTPVQKTGA